MIAPATTKPKLVKKASTPKISKPRKRKKGHYHTGVHISPKCKEPINFRSGWERTICCYLDNMIEVDEYWYESVKIPYVANLRSSRVRYYLPDFVIKFTDGSMKMVEVKRENQLTNLKVMKKAEAARAWCKIQKIKITYEFWTDKLILPLQKIEKQSLNEIKKTIIKKRTKNSTVSKTRKRSK
jgi:hypothetical protein